MEPDIHTEDLTKNQLKNRKHPTSTGTVVVLFQDAQQLVIILALGQKGVRVGSWAKGQARQKYAVVEKDNYNIFTQYTSIKWK